MTAGGPVKRVLVLAEAQKLLETDTGEGRVLRAVAQVRCRAATIGAVAVPGCVLKIAGPRPPKPPRMCRTALTRAAAAPVRKRASD